MCARNGRNRRKRAPPLSESAERDAVGDVASTARERATYLLVTSPSVVGGGFGAAPAAAGAIRAANKATINDQRASRELFHGRTQSPSGWRSSR